MAEFNIKSNNINLNGLQNIEGSTPIKNYPGIQNANNAELKRMVKTLQDLVDERDKKIKKMESDFNNALASIRAEYQTKLDQKFSEYEREYAKVSELVSLLENTFEKKTNN